MTTPVSPPPWAHSPSPPVLRENPSAAASPSPRGDLLAHLAAYAAENPAQAALWCFGIGFVLGWRLKPW